MQTTARQVSHGVIEIGAAAAEVAVAPSFNTTVATASLGVHAVATGAAPEPVVQHKTTAQIESEAEQVLKDLAATQGQTAAS